MCIVSKLYQKFPFWGPCPKYHQTVFCPCVTTKGTETCQTLASFTKDSSHPWESFPSGTIGSCYCYANLVRNTFARKEKIQNDRCIRYFILLRLYYSYLSHHTVRMPLLIDANDPLINLFGGREIRHIEDKQLGEWNYDTRRCRPLSRLLHKLQQRYSKCHSPVCVYSLLHFFIVSSYRCYFASAVDSYWTHLWRCLGYSHHQHVTESVHHVVHPQHRISQFHRRGAGAG